VRLVTAGAEPWRYRPVIRIQVANVFEDKACATMNVIYNSENYYVVEYPAQHGYELVDKQCQRGAFFQGDVADKFAQSLRDVVGQDGASVECVDDFLADFDVLMNQSVLFH
jgi:hypothetical protein